MIYSKNRRFNIILVIFTLEVANVNNSLGLILAGWSINWSRYLLSASVHNAIRLVEVSFTHLTEANISLYPQTFDMISSHSFALKALFPCALFAKSFSGMTSGEHRDSCSKLCRRSSIETFIIKIISKRQYNRRSNTLINWKWSICLSF